MTNLLVMKEYIKSFYAKYEEFIVPVLKFGLALILFITINSRLGYMEAINNPALVLVAALLCSFLPLGVMLFLCGAFLLAHVVALSLECTAVLLLAYLFILVFYLRFSGKNHLVLLVTPLLFVWKVPSLRGTSMGFCIEHKNERRCYKILAHLIVRKIYSLALSFFRNFVFT